MDTSQIIAAMAALANEHRLALFRLLMRRGPSGLAAGRIAEALGISPSSLTFHVGQLERAGLLRSWRVHRQVFYAVEVDGVRRLMTFLAEDCCEGRPEMCGIPLSGSAGQGVGEEEEIEGMIAEKTYNVLFLCTGNSARSIMAESILNRLGAGRFRAFSAGSHPRGEVHPFALDLLRNQNYPIDAVRSKSWDEFATGGAPEMQFVFTVCDHAASEVCPAWPGQPMTAHWGVPDPSAATGTVSERRFAFADAFRMLYTRISIFVSLPMRSLDKLALQRRLDEIGLAARDETRQEA